MTTQIPDLMQLPADQVITAVTGTLRKLFPPRKGTGRNGKPYCFQDGMLTDGQNEIQVTFNDREMDPGWEGMSIALVSKHTKHGWNGVKTKDDTYNGNTKRILWCTPSSEIMLAEDYARMQPDASQSAPPPPAAPTPATAPPAPARTAPPQHSAPAPQAQQQTTHTMTRQPSQHDIQSYRHRHARMASGMVQAMDSAMWVSHQFGLRYGDELPLDVVQKLATSFWIASDRAGMHDILDVGWVPPTPKWMQQEGIARQSQPESPVAPYDEPVAPEQPAPESAPQTTEDEDDVPF